MTALIIMNVSIIITNFRLAFFLIKKKPSTMFMLFFIGFLRSCFDWLIINKCHEIFSSIINIFLKIRRGLIRKLKNTIISQKNFFYRRRSTSCKYASHLDFFLIKKKEFLRIFHVTFTSFYIFVWILKF